MIVAKQEFMVKGLKYVIRSADVKDAEKLSGLRLKIDGETKFLDREPGEGYIDAKEFVEIISNDVAQDRNIFLVAEVGEELVGFSRCQGNELSRLAHKVEFGIAIAKDYWSYGIGKNLLGMSTKWADENHIKKIVLHVLEQNDKAIALYQRFGFQVEGKLLNDKRLADGNYYHTIVMGRSNI